MFGNNGTLDRSTRSTCPHPVKRFVPVWVASLLVSRRCEGRSPGAAVSTMPTIRTMAANPKRVRPCRVATSTAPAPITATANITVAGAPNELMT